MAEHIHHASLCYPDSDAALTIVSSDVAWKFGAMTQLIPVNTITKDFDLHFAGLVMDSNSQYQMNFYRSDPSAYVKISAICAERVGVQAKEDSVPMATPVQEANSRIMCALASSAAAADETTVKVNYHEYD